MRDRRVGPPDQARRCVRGASGVAWIRLTLQPGREETPIVQVFEMRPMAEAVPASALVDGPSHESSLPGRPPDHWLRPSRKSVVNALLPWRDRAVADSFRPGPRTRRAVSIDDRGGLSEREQRLLETDRRQRVSSQNDHVQARTLPAPPVGIRRARMIAGRAGCDGRTGYARASNLEDGDPDRTSCSRPVGIIPAGPGRGSKCPPCRCGSDRIGGPGWHGGREALPWPAECRRRRPAHSALCPIMRRPRVGRRVHAAGRDMVSTGDPCIGPFHGRCSWETWKSSG